MRKRRGAGVLSAAVTLLTAGGVFAACAHVRKEMESAVPKDGGWYRLKPTENPGAGFGLPIDPMLLTGMALGTLPHLVGRWYRERPLSVGLLLGGGCSNLWERLERGSVRDYLQFPHLPGAAGRAVCNLADMAIFAGVGGLMLLGHSSTKQQDEQ